MYKRQHIISPKDEFIDLTDPEYENAMKLTRQRWVEKKKPGEPEYPNGEIVRNEIRDTKKPLLLIYMLDPDGAEIKGIKTPFVGFAVSFPKSRFSNCVSYRINENLIDKFDFDDNVIETYDDED